MYKLKLTKIKNEDRGLAAIFVTMIMMIVISLIVIGFVEISNRERTESLDKQLSTEAFYAAETGVNEVKDEFSTQGYSSSLNKTGCAQTGSIYKQQIDDNATGQPNNVNISCLLVNVTPSSASYQSVQAGQYVVGDINATSLVNVIDVYWQAATMPTSPVFNCLAGGQFPPSIPSTCQSGAGVLRLDLVPGNSLTTNTVLYLYPTNNPADNNPYTVNSSSNGQVDQVYCVANQQPEDCEAQLSVATVSSSPQYYYRIEPLYQDAAVNLLVFNNTTQQDMLGNQIVVDVTGQAQNVLQRIQTSLSLDNNDNLSSSITPPGQPPSNALQSTGSICKDFYYDGTSDTSLFPQNPSCPSFP